ncbi:MAG: catalytic domain [Verrucomicrobiota bacterium]
MAWAYILRGRSGRYYIGSTEDSDRRVREHRRGSNHTTRRFGGAVELVVSRELPSMAHARKTEIALKRKKNPKLAVVAHKGCESSRESFRGWLRVRVPPNPIY